MRKLSEVLRLRLEQKLSVRRIARSCCLAHSTVSDYLERAWAAGLRGESSLPGICAVNDHSPVLIESVSH
ncbi:MAG: hypothetical protein KJ919_06785 [Verrucomicrobia bacterium]|nr:hypothetical protein [Verrucomicrobiota bacterium]MBU4292150.1 hypothetical protein [Verrucomicrobiota bacterium]